MKLKGEWRAEIIQSPWHWSGHPAFADQEGWFRPDGRDKLWRWWCWFKRLFR